MGRFVSTYPKPVDCVPPFSLFCPPLHFLGEGGGVVQQGDREVSHIFNVSTPESHPWASRVGEHKGDVGPLDIVEAGGHPGQPSAGGQQGPQGHEVTSHQAAEAACQAHQDLSAPPEAVG
ncbi:MAG: hypothetical protein DRN28_04535 [Thermoplasmata archaeon]|nr:MAG: hypothetical protein DRN28_04535 [Thermoplasmata archaeon]